MNNKILLGNIIAVVILVLVSFTGVVGFQTTKSSTIARASPLFSVRSKRAIDEQSKDLTCDYFGKGEESILSIPKRDDKTILAQKSIEEISKMNDNTFNRFVELVTSYLQKKNRNSDINVIQALQFIRENPNEAKNLAINGAREDTSDFPCTIDGKMRLRCFLLYLDGIIGVLLFIIFAIFLKLISTSHLTCEYILHFCPWGPE